jgi:hypothetical protein
MLREAESVREQLGVTVRDLELALENEARRRRLATDARQNNTDAEAEVTYELLLNADGKNAEQRRAAVEAALIRERTTGRLAFALGLLAETHAGHADAKLALEQATRRYRATETAAELTAAMLRPLGR